MLAFNAAPHLGQNLDTERSREIDIFPHASQKQVRRILSHVLNINTGYIMRQVINVDIGFPHEITIAVTATANTNAPKIDAFLK